MNTRIDGVEVDFRLPTARKTAWVGALRSGKYVQGRGCLRDNKDNYCCLGVEANLVDPNGWSERDSVLVWGSPNTDPTYIGGFLPPYLLPMPVQYHLAGLNDDGHSFAEIADWIDENL